MLPIFLILKLISCASPPSSAGTISGSSNICEGDSVSYSIKPVSGAKLYTWTIPSDAVIIAGKNTYSIRVKFGKNSGTIKVIPINSCGSGKPDSLFIKINAFPTITASPSTSTLCQGGSVSIKASGANSYVWKPSKGLNDSISATVTATPDSTTTYTIIGKSIQGCENSTFIKIIINSVPKIKTQPLDNTINIGSNAQFTILASGNNLNYQWQQDSGTGFINLVNNGNYSGVSDDTLIIKNVKLFKNNWKFRCVTSNGNCSDTSISVLMKVNCTLKITNQPSNQTINAGSKVLFIFSSSSSKANYQWFADNGSGFIKLTNGGLYSGVTNDTLIINSVKFSQNSYNYKCVAEDDGCLDTTNTVLLKVNCISGISSQPSNQMANVGASVFFTVVSSSSTATYQWQQNSGSGFANLSNGGQYSGATNDSLSISNLTISQNNYTFRCIVLDGGCFDTSNSALLIVKTTGINKLTNQKNFSIYPNPATNFITIESSQTPNNLPFIITDQIGKQVLKGELNNKINTIDIISLAPGFYFLQIGEANREVFKIVKQ